MMSDGGSEDGDGQKVSGRRKLSNRERHTRSLVGDYGSSESDSADEAPGAVEGGAEHSEMVLKNNIINACAHGPLPAETGAAAEARHIIIDSSGGGVIEYSVAEYREGAYSDDSVSSDSFTDVDSVKDAEEHSSSGEEESAEREASVEPEAGAGAVVAPRVRGELGLDDLPPIEELTISVPEHQTSAIGKISNIVDKLVIVQAFPQTPAVDLDSVLFLEKGQRALGKVFDVFGPVTEPCYCVRFNSAEHITQSGVERGLEVFIAPRTDHTNFVFLSELMKMKGSDASWLNDIEPPPGQVEYSDDEDERRANRARREQNRGDPPAAPAAPAPAAPPSQRGPTRFEEQMNKRNLQRTAEANSRFGSSRFRNPFGQRRNPPSAPPTWGGSWDVGCTPPPMPFALARSTFNPYGPPGFNPQTPPPFAPASPFVRRFQHPGLVREPLGVDRGFAQQGVERGFMPPGVDRGFVPPGIDRGFVPPGVDRGFASPGVDRGFMQQVVDRGFASQGVDRGFASQGVDRGFSQHNVGRGFAPQHQWHFVDPPPPPPPNT